MKLKGQSGDFIELSIAGYQFPNVTADEYDSNWLLIDVRSGVRGRSWTTRDACLLTWEVEWLASWLDSVGNVNALEMESSFLEPNLRFEYLGAIDGQHHLRVYFELENRPRWAPADGASMDDLWADLHCSSDELAAAAAELRVQREKCPPRAGVGSSRDQPHFKRSPPQN